MMDSDISKALSYEIRKELADRYFGFRSLIEEEKKDIQTKTHEYALTIEQKVGHDLVRIYIMLREKGLIRQFFELTGLREEIFYDSYTIDSPTITQRVFADVIPKGLTRAGRFKRLFLNLYENLARHLEEYRAKIADLLLEHETVIEEIDLFYKQNDLSHIMSFLRGLDASGQPGHNQLNTAPGPLANTSFEEKMRVLPPDPIDEVFSIIPPIPPLASIKKSLKTLASKAYTLNKDNLPYDRN